MAYKIISEEDISQKEWGELSGNSFFASPQFVSLWRGKKGKPLYYLDEENGKIIAGIVGIVSGKGYLKRFDSMPDGLFGGPYFAPDYDKEKQQKFFTSFEKYIKENNYIRANINKPLKSISSNMFQVQTALEHVLELSDQGSQPLPRGIGTDVRGSMKRGSRVELFDSEGDIDRLYYLAQSSAKRQGRKMNYSKEFFDRLLKISVGNNNILWLKAMLEDQMIASQVTFFDRGEALNWFYYYDKKYSYYKPGYLLADYAIDYSIQNGIKYFSMGSTPGQIESVVKYKERWGCEERSYNNYAYFSFLGKMICGWRRR